MEGTPCQISLDTIFIWALNWKSPIQLKLLIPFIFSMHFVNPCDIRCLLGLCGIEEKEESFFGKEFDSQNKLDSPSYALSLWKSLNC